MATLCLTPYLVSRPSNWRLQKCEQPSLITALGVPKRVNMFRLRNLVTTLVSLDGEAIASTHLEEYYPALLKALEYKSTREASMHALVRLDNEAIPMVLRLATDIHKPDLVRRYAWDVIGQIGTREALNVLVSELMTACVMPLCVNFC